MDEGQHFTKYIYIRRHFTQNNLHNTFYTGHFTQNILHRHFTQNFLCNTFTQYILRNTFGTEHFTHVHF